MEFSRQEYCNGLPFPSPGDLPLDREEILIHVYTFSSSEMPWSPWRLLLPNQKFFFSELSSTRPVYTSHILTSIVVLSFHLLPSLQKGTLLESKIVISGVTGGDSSSMCSMWPSNSMVWSKALHSPVIPEGCPEATWWEQSGQVYGENPSPPIWWVLTVILLFIVVHISFPLKKKDSARDRKKGNHCHRYYQINEQNYIQCLECFFPSDIMKSMIKSEARRLSARQSNNMVKTEALSPILYDIFSLQFDRCLLKLWVSSVWGGEQNHVGPWFCSGSVYVRVWAHTPVTLWSQRVWVSTPMILWSQCVWVSTHMMLWSQCMCVSTPMMLWSQQVCVSTPMILWSQCKWAHP